MSDRKLYIKTFGCQMNQYDSNKMLDVLSESHGFSQTNTPEEADMVLINTCSVREKAEDKLFSALGVWRKLKAKKSDMVIAVGGCVASQEGNSIIKRADYVDIVFGPQTLHRLPYLYEHVKKYKRPIVDVSFPEIEKFDHVPTPKKSEISAYISIMEGCSKYCSFCIVPYTRGEEVSRPFDDILTEAVQLAKLGVREITLLGQNVNDYRGLMADKQYADLALLISYIATVEGIERIRYTTSHPLAFSDNLIEAYKEIPELVNHLHLPVQSGSDKILLLMKRGYSTQMFRDKIAKLRKIRSDVRVSSDFIVGFPGETEADFQKTLDLVDEIEFDQSYSFIYSARPGTPAADIKDETPLEVKQERLSRLQARLRHYAHNYSEAMVGHRHPILTTGPSKKNPKELTGRTECNRIVNFAGPEALIGQLTDVTITEILPNSLRGRISQMHQPNFSQHQAYSEL